MERLKNNKGITLVIFIIIIAVIIGAAATVYFVFIWEGEPKENTTENTVTTQNNTNDNLTNNATEDIMTEITTEWSIKKTLKGNKEVGLQEVYGSSIKYGVGKLTFSNDKTFKDELAPLYNTEDDRKGTYSVDGNEITLKYANGQEDTITYNPSDKTIKYGVFDDYVLILEKEAEENNTNETTEVYNIEGAYYPDIEGANDAPHYNFLNGKVTLEGNYIQTGTYEINGKTIKIHYTKIEGPDEENGKYINESDELTIIDENTLEWNGTDGDQVYNTKYVKK